MKKLLFIFCFSLALNIKAAHLGENRHLYVLDEEIYPEINPEMMQAMIKSEEEFQRMVITRTIEENLNNLYRTCSNSTLSPSSPPANHESSPGYESNKTELNKSADDLYKVDNTPITPKGSFASPIQPTRSFAKELKNSYSLAVVWSAKQ